MSDTTADQSSPVAGLSKPPVGFSRIMAGAVAGGISCWCLNWASLHGVDFKTLGVDSEYVKGGITGSLTGFFVAPDTLLYMMRNFLISCHKWWKILKRALLDGEE